MATDLDFWTTFGQFKNQNIPVDVRRALYEDAKDDMTPDGRARLAGCYLAGWGTIDDKPDATAAKELAMQVVAQDDHAGAYLVLGLCWLIDSGNLEKARDALRHAAKHKVGMAFAILGSLYLYPPMTEPDMVALLGKVQCYYRAALKFGFAPAQYYLTGVEQTLARMRVLEESFLGSQASAEPMRAAAGGG